MDWLDYSADPRFRFDSTRIQSIATSTGQSDHGMFEVNFRDERYLPFEGCGVISEWELVLQENEQLRMFDYNTISDVILQLKYTARDGGGDAADITTFKGKAVRQLADLLKATVPATDNPQSPSRLNSGFQSWRMFSLRHDFSGEWYKMFHPSAAGAQSLQFRLDKDRFPYFTQSRNIKIKNVHLYGSFGTASDYTVTVTGNNKSTTIALTNAAKYYGVSSSPLPAGFGLGDFSITVRNGTLEVTEAELKDLVIVFDYELV